MVWDFGSCYYCDYYQSTWPWPPTISRVNVQHNFVPNVPLSSWSRRYRRVYFHQISEIGYHVSWLIIEQLYTPLLEFAKQNIFLVKDPGPDKTYYGLVWAAESTTSSCSRSKLMMTKLECETFQWVKEFKLDTMVGVQKMGAWTNHRTNGFSVIPGGIERWNSVPKPPGSDPQMVWSSGYSIHANNGRTTRSGHFSASCHCYTSRAAKFRWTTRRYPARERRPPDCLTYNS